MFGPIKRTEDTPKFPMNFGGAIGEAWFSTIQLEFAG
jgi:hypothetical protein